MVYFYRIRFSFCSHVITVELLFGILVVTNSCHQLINDSSIYSCCYILMKRCYQVVDPSSGAGANNLIVARQLTKLKNDKTLLKEIMDDCDTEVSCYILMTRSISKNNDLFLPYTFCSYVITAELLFRILVVTF